LFLDYRVAGQRHRNYTSLPDTPANRAKLKRDLVRIEREIVDGRGTAATTSVAQPPHSARAVIDPAASPSRSAPQPVRVTLISPKPDSRTRTSLELR